MLQRKAVPEIMMDAGAPERFVSILRTQNSGLPRQDESLESASSQKSLKFWGAAANMLAKMSWVRRISGDARDVRDSRKGAVLKGGVRHKGRVRKEGWLKCSERDSKYHVAPKICKSKKCGEPSARWGEVLLVTPSTTLRWRPRFRYRRRNGWNLMGPIARRSSPF